MSIFAYSDMIDELDIQKILQQGYKIELSSRDTVVVSKKNAIVSQIVFTKFRDEVDRMIFEGKVKKETLKNDDVNLLIENIVEIEKGKKYIIHYFPEKYESYKKIAVSFEYDVKKKVKGSVTEFVAKESKKIKTEADNYFKINI